MNFKNEKQAATSGETVSAFLTAFGTGNIDSALTLLTDDVVWHIDGIENVTTVGLLRGKNAIANWLKNFPQSFAPKAFIIKHLIEQDNQVIAIGRFRHLILSTNNIVGSDMAIHFSLRDGKIARYQIFEDSALLSRAFNPTDEWEKQRIRINNTPYAYTDRGEGPTIIFAHGLFVEHSMFEQQIAQLSKSYRCIALDMPAHSASGYNPDGWSLENIADDIALMIEEMSLGPVIFVGHSQGGMVGIRLAAQHPDLIAKLVLIGTSARAEYAERIDNWRQLQHSLEQAKESEIKTKIIDFLQSTDTNAWPEKMNYSDSKGIVLAIDAATVSRTDVRSRLAEITAPTLVICGNADRATPVELSKEIAATIPNATLEVLANAHHNPPLETPRAVTDKISHFLSQ